MWDEGLAQKYTLGTLGSLVVKTRVPNARVVQVQALVGELKLPHA